MTHRSRQPNGASSVYEGKDGYWHGRVTLGVKDDGRPDRRHVMRKTKAEAIKAVRKLERDREDGAVRKSGPAWTVEKWLIHRVENIAAPFVRENTIAGYRVVVNVRLVPGLGKHRLDRLAPEHLEKFYIRMMSEGSSPATAHQAHRTIRTALNEAVRRGHLARNPATLAKAPRLVEKEIEPYTVEEIRLLLKTALETRNGGPAVTSTAGTARSESRREPRPRRPSRALAGGSSVSPPNSSSYSRPTARRRCVSDTPPASSGTTAAGCSPHRPAAR